MAVKSLATAFVNIVPGTQDFYATVKRDINSKMPDVGDEAGQGFGRGLLDGAKKFVAPMLAAFSAVAIGAWVMEGVRSAEELNVKLREVVSLTGSTGAESEKSFGLFKKQVQDLSKELGVAQSTLAEGLYDALGAGVPKENIFGFMQVAAKTAVAGVTDTQTAVDGLTTIINAFGLQADDAGKIADSMFQTVNAGKTTFPELSKFMYEVAPAAAAAKVSFQEVNAALAAMTAQGVPTTVATGNIRAALVGLQRPSEEMDAIFQKLGYSNAQTAIESQGLGFALGAVKDAAGGNNGVLQKLLGSVEAVQAANILAGTGASLFASEMQKQTEVTGQMQRAFDEVDKARSLERFRTAMDNIGIAIGDAVMPVLADLADYVVGTAIPAMQDFGKWVKDNGTWLGPLAVALAAGAAAFAVVNGVTSIATGLQAGFAAASYGSTAATYALGAAQKIGAAWWFITNSALWTNTAALLANTQGGLLAKAAILASAAATGIATAAQWAWNAALTANPIGILIVAIAALVAGLVWFFTQTELGRTLWQGFVDGLAAAWTWFYESVVQPVMEAIGAAFTWLWETIIRPFVQAVVIYYAIWGAIFTWLYENVVKPVMAAIGDMFTWLYQNIIKPVIDKVVASIQAWGAIFTWLYNNIVKPVFDALGAAFNWVWTNVIKPVVQWITDAIDKVGSTVSDVFGSIANTVGDAFRAVVGVVRGPINSLIDLLNGMIGRLNGIRIDIPEFARDLFGGASSIGFNIPNIPHLAKGGFVTGPTTALIGEAGPEVVTPLKDFERMMNLDGNGKTVNYYAAPNQSIDSEQALFTALKRAKVLAAW